MSCEQKGSSFEIRTQGELPDGRPALDEIVARNAQVHLEQMARDQWWVGLEAGGKYFHRPFKANLSALPHWGALLVNTS
jgi:hypothetical protein